MRVHESSMPNESKSLNSHQLSSSFGPAFRSKMKSKQLHFCLVEKYHCSKTAGINTDHGGSTHISLLAI